MTTFARLPADAIPRACLSDEAATLTAASLAADDRML
jgi:hypothetical protein